MNIISFDIEEWALAKAGGYDTSEKIAKYDAYLNQILDALDERDFKATFFCTGSMAEWYPRVVRLIQSRGHEIGCHSYRHTWMNKMDKIDAFEDTQTAVDTLEQCIGEKVLSYRAPAFSIGRRNEWMFNILAECGIERDSSVFPSTRDFGGFADFGSEVPCVVLHNGVSIKEFPIPMANVLGKRIAYSGGGYFRFFPLGFVRKQIKASDYSMCYFHIGDLLPEAGGVPSKESYESYYKEPGTLKNRYMRYIKTNLGKNGAMNKMMKMIATENFVSLSLADADIDWQKASKIEL